MNNNRNAFTLVELVITIVIVSIISIVGFIEYSYHVEKSRAMEAISLIRVIADAEIAYYIENGKWCYYFDELPIIIEGNPVDYYYSARRTKYFVYYLAISQGSDQIQHLGIGAVRCHNGEEINYSSKKSYDINLTLTADKIGKDRMYNFRAYAYSDLGVVSNTEKAVVDFIKSRYQQ